MQNSEGKMSNFDYSFTVDAPLEAVADFHHDTSALKKLAMPGMFVQLHDVEPLDEGSVSKFTMWLGPLPLPWKAVHSNVGPNGFTDTQESGPAAKWVHTHTFTPISPTQTRVDEHVVYEHKPGLKGLLTRFLFAKPNLTIMFSYRQWATRRALADQSPSMKPEATTG